MGTVEQAQNGVTSRKALPAITPKTLPAIQRLILFLGIYIKAKMMALIPRKRIESSP